MYRPRHAEASVLYAVIRQHLDEFLRAAATRADGAGLPEFIAREFREFLTCGVLATASPECAAGTARSSTRCPSRVRAAASARAAGLADDRARRAPGGRGARGRSGAVVGAHSALSATRSRASAAEAGVERRHDAPALRARGVPREAGSTHATAGGQSDPLPRRPRAARTLAPCRGRLRLLRGGWGNVPGYSWHLRFPRANDSRV